MNESLNEDMPAMIFCPKCDQEMCVNVEPDVYPIPYGCTVECGMCGTHFKVEKGQTAN